MKPIRDGFRGLAVPSSGALLPPLSVSWAGPGVILVAAFFIYAAAGYVDARSWLGGAAVGAVTVAALLTAGVACAAGRDRERLSRGWAAAYPLWAVVLALVVAADTGKAGSVSPAVWVYILLFAVAARGFGTAYRILLAILSAVLMLLAELVGEAAGYPADYQVTSLTALVLLAAGLLFLARSAATQGQPAGDRVDRRLSAGQLEAAARESAAAVAVFDSAGGLRFASPALEPLFRKGGSWAPQPEDSAAAGRPRGPRAALAAALEGRPERVEFVLHGADGREHSIDGVFFPLDEGAGLIGIDVTDLREVQVHLSQVQRMEMLGLLAGGLAHDFNNLLTVIRGNLDVMARVVGDSPDAREILEETSRACERSAAVLRQLLDYARQRDLAVAPVVVEEVLSETAALARGLLPSSVQLEVGRPPGGATVTADPAALQQVLLNLIVNARDALPNGGRIVVRAREAGSDILAELRKRGLSGGAYQEISVADTGLGMDANTLAHAFDPFFTTKEAGRGTGLGLTTAQSIVRSFGGLITAQSAPAEGSTFSVVLPSSLPEAPDQTSTGSARERR